MISTGCRRGSNNSATVVAGARAIFTGAHALAIYGPFSTDISGGTVSCLGSGMSGTVVAGASAIFTGAGALTVNSPFATQIGGGTFSCPCSGMSGTVVAGAGAMFTGAGGLTVNSPFATQIGGAFSCPGSAMSGTVVAGAGAMFTGAGALTINSPFATQIGGGTFSCPGSGMTGTVVNAGGVIINTVVPSSDRLLGTFQGNVSPSLVENVVEYDNVYDSPASDTSSPNVVSFAAYRRILQRLPSQSVTSNDTTFGLVKDDPKSRFETKQLISEFLEDTLTEETMENYELAMADIIDRHGKTGITALNAQLFRPAVEPLTWRLLGALGVRRGLPLDNLAKRILLTHLNSTSAGRRSAAASALGAFPDGVVLAALQRRAAIETNRIVLATLKAHIRVLRRDGLSIAKVA